MRRRRIVRAAALLALAAAFVVLVVNPDSRLEQAHAIVDDDDRFATATDAAVAFGRISTLLKREGEDCGDIDDERCQSYYSAAAWAQLTAVELLECTRPGVFKARTRMRRHLNALAESEPPGGLPDLVSCR